MVRRRSLMCLLALVTSTSCDGSSPGVDCSDDVLVSVGPGLTPEISWRPACLAVGLIVEALDGSGSTMWVVTTANRPHGIAPPVVYGTIPAGADPASELLPLVAGSRYRVAVEAVVNVPGGGTRVGAVGTAEFTP